MCLIACVMLAWPKRTCTATTSAFTASLKTLIKYFSRSWIRFAEDESWEVRLFVFYGIVLDELNCLDSYSQQKIPFKESILAQTLRTCVPVKWLAYSENSVLSKGLLYLIEVWLWEWSCDKPKSSVVYFVVGLVWLGLLNWLHVWFGSSLRSGIATCICTCTDLQIIVSSALHTHTFKTIIVRALYRIKGSYSLIRKR